MVKLFIEKGASLNPRISAPLHFAAKNEDPTNAKFLLEIGMGINAIDLRDYTPLHDAAAAGRYETTKFLIENGANLNARANCGSTPLHFAITEGRSLPVVELLIEKVSFSFSNE
jgi:ankyrin repeat protein